LVLRGGSRRCCGGSGIAMAAAALLWRHWRGGSGSPAVVAAAASPCCNGGHGGSVNKWAAAAAALQRWQRWAVRWQLLPSGACTAATATAAFGDGDRGSKSDDCCRDGDCSSRRGGGHHSLRPPLGSASPAGWAAAAALATLVCHNLRLCLRSKTLSDRASILSPLAAARAVDARCVHYKVHVYTFNNEDFARYVLSQPLQCIWQVVPSVSKVDRRLWLFVALERMAGEWGTAMRSAAPTATLPRRLQRLPTRPQRHPPLGRLQRPLRCQLRRRPPCHATAAPVHLHGSVGIDHRCIYVDHRRRSLCARHAYSEQS
jgi:hypothetical protein